jgi:hypothetical protein
MDWITPTKQQVENDASPRLCMVCGAPATCCVNKSFSHTPDWVEWLYFAGFFPGLIAEHFFTKELRIACPFCSKHRNHWRSLYWLAGIGWLASVLVFGGLGWVVGIAVGSTTQSAPIGAGVGAGVGLIVWLAGLIYLDSTRIGAKKVTDDEITLQGVHDSFAKAVKGQQSSAKRS